MDRVPFVVAMFFGALGWTVTHVVDRITSSPAIEYSIHQKKSAGEVSEVSVTLVNLSTTIAHRDLAVLLRKENSKSKDGFVPGTCEIVAIAPTSLGVREEANCDHDVAEFKAKVFPPQGVIHLRAVSIGSEKVLLTGGPTGVDDSESSYYLQSSGLETWLVRNELAILLGALSIWVILMLLWFYRRNKGDKKEDAFGNS